MVYIDAIHYSVREDGVVRKLAACVILGFTLEGKKKVLSIQIGENESSKYWISVLNELKNRGGEGYILILCSDDLMGIKFDGIFQYILTESKIIRIVKVGGYDSYLSLSLTYHRRSQFTDFFHTLVK